MWIKLNSQNLTEVLNSAELDAMAEDDASCLDKILGSVTDEVRQSIANWPQNKLDPSEGTIPMSLKNLALDLAVWRLIKRFDLSLSDARQAAYNEARRRLDQVAAGIIKISTEQVLPDPTPKPYYRGRKKRYGYTDRGGVM